jgi:uncharacterized protein YdhG (YjbR/CyaY superfamily)
VRDVPATVDEYIEAFPEEVRTILRRVREAVRTAAPQAEERISYRMPALFQHGVLVYYAAFKRHIGLYPPVKDEALRAEAAPYAGPKGNLQFPYSKPVPCDLIARIVESRLRANLAATSGRRAVKSKVSARRTAR